MEIIKTIYNVGPNKKGIAALCPNSDNCLLAYPSKSGIGNVEIYDACKMVSMVQKVYCKAKKEYTEYIY